MSRFIDRDGRIAGRINLVDALCLLFLAGLIPLAYASWLLFQTATPRIHSVERSEVTWAEEKIAAGLPIRLKVKIRGENLTPMLRARIGGVPALGFTFESPASGDVIIGADVPAGTHDLVLYDGGREVARVPDAVTIEPVDGVQVRAIGAFTLLDESSTRALKAGQQFMSNGDVVAEIIALGDPKRDRLLMSHGRGAIEVERAETWGREAVVRLRCSPAADATSCRVDGKVISDGSHPIIRVPGSKGALPLRVDGVVPDRPPVMALARLRVDGDSRAADRLQVGDRDAQWPAIDDRTATITAVRRTATGVDVAVRLGLDRTRTGWRYHAQPFAAGEEFSFVTANYSVVATVLEVVTDES